MEEVNVKLLLRTIYLTLYQYGHKEVSLKNEDLLEYVPKIKEVLMAHGLKDNDLFIKTPIEETYNEYKNFLIKDLYGNKLGSFNDKYDTIILNCPVFYVRRCQQSMSDYNELIHKCSYLISNDIQLIDDDNAFEILSLIKDVEKRKQYKK